MSPLSCLERSTKSKFTTYCLFSNTKGHRASPPTPTHPLSEQRLRVCARNPTHTPTFFCFFFFLCRYYFFQTSVCTCIAPTSRRLWFSLLLVGHTHSVEGRADGRKLVSLRYLIFEGRCKGKGRGRSNKRSLVLRSVCV